MKTYTSPERKLKKVMVEKRRRTRIDRALVQMKNMVLEALHVQPEKYAKMEKADILDLTVRFLRRVRQERHTAVTSQDPRQLYPAAMYPHPAATATAPSGSNPYPFKMTPLRPIPTSLAGHPYAHIPPYRPGVAPRYTPMKSDSGMTSQLSQMASRMTSLPSMPRRVPTATVTSSEVGEPSSTSHGPDSPVPMTTRDLTMGQSTSLPQPRTSSPIPIVTSSSENTLSKLDSNNNDKPAVPGPSTSRQTTPPPSSSLPQPQGRRHNIEAPIPLRMIKFDQIQDFPLFGPGVWRPWFA